MNSIDADEHQLTVRAQIEWQKLVPVTDETSRLLTGAEEQNSTKLLNMEMRNGDLVTVWLEDAILNEILDQIDWNFEWMDEQIPVSSPIIPPDSREFLSTLCTECYFQVNVNAKGRPTIVATNSSLQLTKTDRIHLQVVNPDKKKTTVFVSLVLTIQAELRPSFDNGTLRTGVELLDTRIVMEQGAFPKTWGFFMEDLIRGMIMDMMWPEIKSAIEDLTYGKGLKLSKFCGVDPNNVLIDIGEWWIVISFLSNIFSGRKFLAEHSSRPAHVPVGSVSEGPQELHSEHVKVAAEDDAFTFQTSLKSPLQFSSSFPNLIPVFPACHFNFPFCHSSFFPFLVL